MGTVSVLVLGLLVVTYAPLSRRLESSVLTPPMLFTAAGLLLGPSVLDVLDRNADVHDLEVLTEAALAVLLFTKTASLDLRKVVREAGSPLRLLGVGMPLTMALGTLALIGTGLSRATVLYLGWLAPVAPPRWSSGSCWSAKRTSPTSHLADDRRDRHAQHPRPQAVREPRSSRLRSGDRSVRGRRPPASELGDAAAAKATAGP